MKTTTPKDQSSKREKFAHQIMTIGSVIALFGFASVLSVNLWEILFSPSAHNWAEFASSMTPGWPVMTTLSGLGMVLTGVVLTPWRGRGDAKSH